MKCYQGQVPMMQINNGKLKNIPISSLPVVIDSWNDFTKNDNRGSFNYSVVPIIYSISTSMVVTVFLTLFVLTSYTIKPSLILKASTILSSIFIIMVGIKSMYDLHVQQESGFLFGAVLLNSINTPIYLSVVDLVVVFLLQINQVQVIMRLFSRQNDKRLTLIVGLSASLSSQIIWGVSKFTNFGDISEAGDIIPTFIYLTRTSMAICYAALISVFLVLKINYILANKQIWLLTILTFILIYGPVAFFISDVANAFVYELSEIFSVATYVVTVVIPWEWCNKFNLIMKAKEKEGVLGRRFYEDELYELDGLELFVEESDDDRDHGTRDLEQLLPNNHNEGDDGNNHDNDGTARNGAGGSNTRKLRRYKPLKPKNTSLGLLNTFDRTKQAFFDITDTIIATGFAIPRSASIPSSPFKKNDETTDPKTTDAIVAEQQQNPNRHRRDIFVYSTKQVVLGED
ncbi:pH-response regulator protein palH/RIM21 [[Candida] jaroonii]|uniref:PH-response regulator protein palH/RIM21 n=1 Tax=[Candida] jaroonii TaxID=467808 RepID=A0ACA9Y1H9_9ASCO|nr:pH-response regulator protein palH/RIM21 [[Candida] jaroonii]